MVDISHAVNTEGYTDVEVVPFSGFCGPAPVDWEAVTRDFQPGQAEYSKTCLLSGCLNNTQTPLPAGISTTCVPQSIETCFKMFASPDIVARHINAGAYLLTPGWLAEWQEHMAQWGLDSETAPLFFADFTRYLVLLDTGIKTNSQTDLQAFANFVGLPFEILPTGLDYFRLFFKTVVQAWQLEQQQQKAAASLDEAWQQSANYAMVQELIGGITRVMSEDEAITQIFELFTMLFAPAKLVYMPVRAERPEPIIAQPDWLADDFATREALSNFKGDYAWTESETGFILRISHRQETLGILEADQIAFPQYRKRYLNQALTVVGVCGLAIANARTYQQITKQKNELEQTLQQLRETQQQLIEAEKMASLGNLVAGVAHEINTPVGVGITTISALIEKNNHLSGLFHGKNMKRSDLEKLLDFTDTAANLVLTNLQRTGELIQSFKQVSVDQTVEQQRKFNVKSYLQNVLRSLQGQLKQNSIQVNVECDNDLELNSYAGVFAQVITNLVNNSIIHGFAHKNQGQIDVQVFSYENQVRLIYRDNGVGIAADILPKIFDPFFTTNKQRGTGLGLHIIYNLITQKLNGTIQCNSEYENGAVFTIMIPKNLE